MTCPCCESIRVQPVLINGVSYRHCRQCNFLFQPLRTTKNQDDLLRHYATVDPHRRVADSKQAFFQYAIRQLGRPRGVEKRLLDVGCGYGYFLEQAGAAGWLPFGVEISFDAVAASRRKFGNANVFHGRLTESGFESDMFDAVTFWDVLVFSQSPFSDLVESRRILKQGGVAGIRVRNVIFQRALYGLFKPFSKAACSLGFKAPYVFHPNCFSPESVRFLLERAGFVDIRIENSPLTSGDPYGHTRISGLTRLAKIILALLIKTWSRLNGQGRFWGPSLLVWARKL